ncbi:hypothetical protein D3C85_1209250 [compost metagenome]
MHLAATVVAVVGGVPGGVGIAVELAVAIKLIVLTAPIGQLRAEQSALGIVLVLGTFAEGIGDSLQMPAPVIAEAGRIP